MKQTKLLLAAAVLFAAALSVISCHKKSNPAPAAVFDCSTMAAITTNTTYPVGTYTVTCNIDVSNNAVLTISPGTVLAFSQGASLTIEAGAAISAAGTSSQPIVFKGTEAIQGYWDGIFINSISLNNVFSNCTISDAGASTGNTFGANVTLDDATVSFTNCTISNSKDAGVFMTNTNADATVFNTFTNNTVSGNSSYPVITFAAGAGTIGTGNTFTGNSNNYIGIRDQSNDGTSVNITLNPQPVPYLFMQTGTDYGVMFNKSLTIMPGTVIAMGSGTSIEIAPTGSISAAGTSASPIVIKGLQATAGYWGCVFVQSNNSSNSLMYCNISDGGGAAGIQFDSQGGLVSTYEWIENSRSVTVKNCNLSNSSSSGVFLTHSSGYTVTYNSDIATGNTFTGCSPNVQF